MEEQEPQFEAMSSKLLSHELKVKNRALEDLRSDYMALKSKESELQEKTRWEQGRLKGLEDRVEQLVSENERLNDEMLDLIRERDSLSTELTALRRKSNNASVRSTYDSEIINYRAKIAGLESKLERRQQEFDKYEAELKAEIERLQTLFESSTSYYEKENLNSSSVDKMNELHFKIGDLTATNKALRDEINRHVTEKSELQQEMKLLREEMESLKGMNSVLQERVKETEGSNDAVSKYYADEITKIKQQKAELRCDLIKLRREHDKLLQDGHDTSEKEAVEKELAEYKKKVQELESKLIEVKRTAAETESSEKGKVEQLLSDLSKANDALAKNQQALETLDKQADLLVKRIQTENANKKAAKKKIVELEAEMKLLKDASNNQKILEDEVQTLKSENERLIKKVAYLEVELQEINTDHREELAKLAKQVTAARTAPVIDERKTQELHNKIAQLEAMNRQTENVVKYLKREVEHAKTEKLSAEQELAEIRKKQTTMSEENTDLRRALQEAITKIKTFKEKEDKLLAANAEHQERLDEMDNEILKYKDEICELKNALSEKDDNIAYLQSIQQPRKLEKLKITSSESMLVTDRESQAEVNILRSQRDEIARQVSEKTKILEKKREEITPLLKLSYSGSDNSLEYAQSQTSSSSQALFGTMRHDIPHRWTKTVFWTTTPSCEVCCERVSRFSQAFRCTSCRRIIHSYCRSKMGNNCGFPAACANFYIENHKAGPDLMSGWVKVWKKDGTEDKWINSFACLEGDTLAFYESDVAFAQRFDPIFTVALAQQRWKIYNQTGNVEGVDPSSADCLIEIKLQDVSLFMLTLTAVSKMQWMRALHEATNRRIYPERKESERSTLAPVPILSLGPPLLTFTCTEIYQDWLLIGTPQGLFATNYSAPRMPFQIAGFRNILQIKYIPEYNLLFAVDGAERDLVVLHGLQLDNALTASHAPRVQTTAYTNLPATHLIEVSDPKHGSDRYLYVGTSEGISIFKYVSKRDMFIPHHDIELEVPAMSIVPVEGGFVFSSDRFYFVSQDTWAPSSFRTDWPPDSPISVVKISDEEVLLVNHNFGVFTTPQGARTRRGNIEWEFMPVSVHYCEPYLFVIHTDKIGIIRLVPADESNDNTAIVEPVSGFRAPSARYTGTGKNPYEVLLTVRDQKCIELNLFNPMKNSLKRKPTTMSLQSAKRKF